MSRLGVLYALKEDKLNKLRSLPQDERYDYMLEEIEETLLETPHGYELDKAWEGIQYCLGGGNGMRKILFRQTLCLVENFS